jgi:hypothetical protein
VIHEEASQVVPELFVEELLELDRPLPLAWLSRVERRVGPSPLERRDDPRRVRDGLAIDAQHRHRRLPRHPEDAGIVQARKQRTTHVRDALEVEGQRTFSAKCENVKCQMTGCSIGLFPCLRDGPWLHFCQCRGLTIMSMNPPASRRAGARR